MLKEWKRWALLKNFDREAKNAVQCPTERGGNIAHATVSRNVET